MRKQKVLAKEFEFYFPNLDNLLLVESLEDGSVRVRFTKNNLSEKRKMLFIRELAAEGFIPDDYQWFADSNSGPHRVEWIKDYSWLKLHPVVTRRTNRFMGLLLAGSCVLLLAMMRIAIASSPPSAVPQPGARVTAAWRSPALRFMDQQDAPADSLIR